MPVRPTDVIGGGESTLQDTNFPNFLFPQSVHSTVILLGEVTDGRSVINYKFQ